MYWLLNGDGPLYPLINHGEQNIYDVHDYSKTGWPMLIRHPFDVRMATQ